MYGGYYAKFNVVAGNTYEWSTCGDFYPATQGASFDGELSLFDASLNSLCFNNDCGRADCPHAAYISWYDSNITGVVYLLLSNAWFGPCQSYFYSYCNVVWRQSAGANVACSGWFVSPTYQILSGEAQNNSFTLGVTSGNYCPYLPVSNNQSWIPNADGNGSTITYSVTQNNTGSLRPGSISVFSNGIAVATFQVYQNPCIAVSVSSTQPASQTLCAGATAYFSVTASNGPYTYQWQKGTTNLTNGTKYENVNSAILKINNITSDDEGSYSCYVTGCGASNATSAAGQLSIDINSTPPSADFYTSNNRNDISVGESVSFSPSNPCTGCTYQWQFQNGNPSTSPLQNPIVTYNASNSNTVSLVVTNSCGVSSNPNSIYGFITVKPTSSQSTQVVPQNNIVNQDGYQICYAGEPVKIPTLDYGYNNSVLSMNTVAGILEFKVYYNSNNTAYASNLGVGWSNNFDYKIENDNDTVWRVFYGEGYSVPFIKLYNGNGASFPKYAGIFEKLYKDPVTNIYTLTFKNGTVYSFDAQGKLDYIKDRYGNTTDLNYDGNGFLINITGEGGRHWDFTNDATGKITQITDPASRSVQFLHSGSDITGIVDPDLDTTSFQYDGSHLMTNIINPGGNLLLQNVYTNGKVTTQYDVNGKATTFYANTPATNYTTVVFPDGSNKVYLADSFYRVHDEQDEEGHHIVHGYYADNTDSLLIDKNGNQTSFEKDTVGNITAIHRPLGVNEFMQYDTHSLPTSVTDGEGFQTLHNRDSAGNEIETVLPDLTHIERAFSSKGQLLSEKNELNTTSYVYAPAGDITHIQTPTGGVVISSNAIGWDTARTNQIGQRTNRKYNGRGLEIRFKDIDGKSILTAYDKNSNKISLTDKMFYVTRFIFDSKDRQIATLNVYKDTIDRKYYDDRDFIIATKSANGGITKYVNDKVGRPKQIFNPLGGETDITRDNNGNIISSTDIVTNITTTYSFDSLNRNYSTTVGTLTSSKTFLKNSWLSSMTNARGLTTQFLYTPLGKIKDVQDPNQVHSIITYNKLGSPQNVTDPNGNTTATIYDSVNRPYQYQDALGHLETKSLDKISRVTLISKANGVSINTTNFTQANLPKTVVYSTGENLNFSYDGDNNIKTATGPLGTSSLFYDASNHAKEYFDPFGNTILYHSDAAGNLLSLKYQTGKSITYKYNKLNQITTVKDWRNAMYTSTYNAAGQLLKVTYPNKMYCVYGYDNNGMVISKIWKKSNGTIIYADTVTRSSWGDVSNIACGNCYPKILQSTNYGAIYDSADQIIQDSLATHYFDKSGNDTLIKGDSNSVHVNYTANNVVASFSSDTATTSFGYDAFFNRIKRTENGIEKRYVINAGLGLTNVLMEQNSAGTTTAWNIYGSGLIARIDSAGKACYYITDIKHNVVALIDDSANVTDSYIYDLSGKIWKHIGNNSQPYTWLGEYGVQKENDSVYFVRARYYDAKRGRFFNRDPHDYDVNNPQTINRYVYALNNAVNIFDYTGLTGNRDDGNNKADLTDYLASFVDNGVSLKLNISHNDIYWFGKNGELYTTGELGTENFINKAGGYANSYKIAGEGSETLGKVSDIIEPIAIGVSVITNTAEIVSQKEVKASNVLDLGVTGGLVALQFTPLAPVTWIGGAAYFLVDAASYGFTGKSIGANLNGSLNNNGVIFKW